MREKKRKEKDIGEKIRKKKKHLNEQLRMPFGDSRNMREKKKEER